MSKLALLGGPQAVTQDIGDMFHWPIVNKDMEEAALKVLRSGSMSGTDITKDFEKEYAGWHGMEYGLACCNGTASLQSAFFGIGLKPGDEIISPSTTYWATCLPVLSLGVSVKFADICPDTLCVNPVEIEKQITERTKAIVVVHYLGMPCDMDAIMALAKKHNLKVVEDVSHAHGALYKGQMVGTFGDASCFSLMSGKSFAIGEGGIMLTNHREVYERAILWGHYARHSEITDKGIAKNTGLPWGGYKYRMNQFSSAIGLEQLKKYPTEMKEIDKAMNYFWDSLEGVPGLKALRPESESGSTMGGWYAARGFYIPEELNGLSVKRFCEAIKAEGVNGCIPGCNQALHQHPVFNTTDIYGHGRATNSAFLPVGIENRQNQQQLPVAEAAQSRCYSVPWFKHFRQDFIDEYVIAFKKVVENHRDLLDGDDTNASTGGNWGLFAQKK